MGLSCFVFFSSTLFDTHKKHLTFEENVLLKMFLAVLRIILKNDFALWLSTFLGSFFQQCAN